MIKESFANTLTTDFASSHSVGQLIMLAPVSIQTDLQTYFQHYITVWNCAVRGLDRFECQSILSGSKWLTLDAVRFPELTLDSTIVTCIPHREHGKVALAILESISYKA